MTFATRRAPVWLAAAAAACAAAAAPAARARLGIPTRSDQLIVVSSETARPPGAIASLRAYQRTDGSVPWRRVLGSWPAETGYGHLSARRHEGDGSTPIGVFGIGAEMYGTDPNPGGLHYAYRHVACGDWWDEDPFSRQYNRLVHVRCATAPPFGGDSEPLWRSPRAYRYFAFLRFNVDPVVRGRHAPGSAIFLHSWVGGATAGCVALGPARLLRVLRWLRPDLHPVIEIGTDRQVTPPPGARLPARAAR